MRSPDASGDAAGGAGAEGRGAAGTVVWGRSAADSEDSGVEADLAVVLADSAAEVVGAALGGSEAAAAEVAVLGDLGRLVVGGWRFVVRGWWFVVGSLQA